MSKSTKKLLLEMFPGIMLYELVMGMAAVLLRQFGRYVLSQVFLGLAAGMIADIFMLIHMACVTEHVLAQADASYASKKTVVHSILRKIFFIVALLFVGSLPQVNIVAMLIGAFGLKPGAYLQPVIHKIFSGKEDFYGNDQDANSG